jgi:hypothetical protein
MTKTPIRWGGGMYWTSSKRSWLGLFASLRDGRVLLRHELTWDGQAPEDAALDILRFYRDHQITDCVIVANPALWPDEKTAHGYTVSEAFQRAGVRMRRGSDDRVNGLARIHSLLAIRKWKTIDRGEEIEITSPALLVHEDCRVIARVFPVVMEDEHNPDDIRKSPLYNPILGLMAYAMSRPLPTPTAPRELPPGAIGHWVNEIRSKLPKSARADVLSRVREDRR